MGFISFLIVLIGGMMVGMGALSQHSPTLGLRDGKLLPCPGRPNCRCTESFERVAVHNLAKPLHIEGMPAGKAWARLKVAIHATGGVLLEADQGYLRATYSSGLFRFVDDLEARLDEGAGVIHLRSASRVGFSDLGANRIRLDRLRAAFRSS